MSTDVSDDDFRSHFPNYVESIYIVIVIYCICSWREKSFATYLTIWVSVQENRMRNWLSFMDAMVAWLVCRDVTWEMGCVCHSVNQSCLLWARTWVFLSKYSGIIEKKTTPDVQLALACVSAAAPPSTVVWFNRLFCVKLTFIITCFICVLLLLFLFYFIWLLSFDLPFLHQQKQCASL